MDNFRSFLESIAISCHFYFLQSDSRSPFQTAAVFQNGTMRGSSFFSFRLTPFSTYFSLMLRIRSRILRMPVGISVNSLCVSIMLIFNTSLSQALGVHKQVNGWMQTRMTKDASEKPVDLDEEDEEGEDDNLLIDDTDEMEDDEEEKIPEPKKSLFRASPLKEQPVAETVLTSKKRRNITIPLDLLE